MFKKPEEKGTRCRQRRRIPIIAIILMGIGLITVLYLLITYVLMPVLAMLTVS